MSPGPDLSMDHHDIRSFLSEPVTGVLSTIGPGGFPHAVTMYYVLEGDDFKLWPFAKSQKVLNIERDPRCSLLVEHGVPYQDLRGVLVRARAKIVRDREPVLELGRAIYERYFLPRTGIAFDEGPSERISVQAAKRVAIVVPIERVASWDHGRSSSKGP